MKISLTPPAEIPIVRPPLRLLHIEHEADDVELCARELKNSGLDFTMETVTTPDELTRNLQQQTFDIILADYRLPGWSGVEALAQIKALGFDIPLILVTGTLGDETAVECMKIGVTDYVLKTELARLPMAIRRALEEKKTRVASSRALEALRDSEARYRGLVNNATYGIYRVTLDGQLLFVNPALVHILGYDSAEELLAVRHSQALFVDAAVREKLLETYRKNGRVDSRVEWKRKDAKPITVHLSGRRVKDSQNEAECIEVIIEDVTEHLTLEKQYREAQKFEAFGQLAGGIAHDFNNMIGAIMGWADLGIDETESTSRLQHHFQKIRQQAERAAALTRQLLAFARRQILEPRNMELNLTVTETISLLEKVIGSNIEIKTSLAPDLAVVRADPTQIEQVLMNLCINARDAMPNGGHLTIESRNVSTDEKSFPLQPPARLGSFALLSVSDSGAGMDARTLDRIFEPFFTTKETGKGTGLGLATVYGIVQQHGGFIKVSSKIGLGSTFNIYLPAILVPADATPRAENNQPVRGGSETILVAEDHEGLREIAREALIHSGYRVLLACDGEQAVRMFQENREQINLLVFDVVLPKLSGPEAYSKIAATKPGVLVIFATGYSADVASLNKIQQQGLPVIQKPYSPRDLARKVRETLDRRLLPAAHD